MTAPQNDRAFVLVVDDSHETLFILRELLEGSGFGVEQASGGEEALSKLEKGLPDLILSDVNMPGMDGLELSRRVKKDPVLRFIPIVLLTARDASDEITAGLDAGADDYITKPFQKDELLARVRAALRMKKLYAELKAAVDLNEKLSSGVCFENMTGQSGAIQKVYALIEKVSQSDIPVLISGESGTGKELAAHAMHFRSRRKAKPFIVANCAALNENLLESELFGHVRGAFTGAIRDKKGLFEAADGGTLFLDEFAEMSQALQVKLLRVLQDGSFTPVGSTQARKADVRIIAATNRNLREMVAGGAFREDLFYRISAINISLPPLRERKSDIPHLISFFLNNISKKSSMPVKALSSEALLLLCDYNWPGNIRELQNEIERLVVLAGSEEPVGVDLVSPHIIASEAGSREETAGSLKDAVARVEREMIASALKSCGGNKSEAARALGISRSNLIAKVQMFSLE